MRNKLIFVLLVFILTVSMLIGACSQSSSTSTSVTTSSMPQTTTTQSGPSSQFQSTTKAPQQETASVTSVTQSKTTNWWDKWGEPQYGDTLLQWGPSLDYVTTQSSPVPGKYSGSYGEALFWVDITVDPAVHKYEGEYVTPQYWKGQLAESWEQTDPTTIIVKLRQGYRWQNLDPVNGREINADDIVYNYEKTLGIGSGFTRPDPMVGPTLANIAKIVAKDKYTVEFTFKKAGFFQTVGLLSTAQYYMISPEVDKKYGATLGDVRNAVGTGPWIFKDLIKGNTMTFEKNPDYSGKDYRHPDKKVPYMDGVKIMAIPDTATAIAAMRTGKIDIMTDRWGGITPQMAKQLEKTNPDIQMAWLPRQGAVVELRVDKPPFTDIKVRAALQMAIDLKAIAESIYVDTVDPVPVGLINPLEKGWCTPFNEWPAELQQEYTYNLGKARQYLAEAGYPNGFQTNCVVAATDDLNLLQVIKAFFKEISVDMEIRSMDRITFMAFVQGGKHDQMNMWDHCGQMGSPYQSLSMRINATGFNPTHNNDPVYEQMYKDLGGATSDAEAKSIAVKMDMYSIQQHWAVNILPIKKPCGYQPWLKGYNGEDVGGVSQFATVWWIDQDLKK